MSIPKSIACSCGHKYMLTSTQRQRLESDKHIWWRCYGCRMYMLAVLEGEECTNRVTILELSPRAMESLSECERLDHIDNRLRKHYSGVRSAKATSVSAGTLRTGPPITLDEREGFAANLTRVGRFSPELGRVFRMSDC